MVARGENAMESDEKAVELLAHAVERAARRPQPNAGLSLMASVRELARWLADDHQVADAGADHWRSLVGDVATGVAECGTRLHAVIVDGYEELEDHLEALRSQLRDRRGSPDRSLLRRLNRVADHLMERASCSRARRAALDDLVEAAQQYDLELAEGRARVLADLGPSAGWPTRLFARRVYRALRDGGDEALARAAQIAVRDEPLTDHAVWLRFHVARLGKEDALNVGSSVTLFDGERLAAALEGPNSEPVSAAPELAADPTYIRSLAGHRTHGVTDDGKSPFVVGRFAVPGVRPGEALDRARQTAETLVALGVLYGSDPGVWVLDPSYVIFAGGRYTAATFSADVETRLPAFAGLALQKDRTAATLEQLEDTLGPYLPVSDTEIAEAARLLQWLQQAQLTAASPRLLLCDRVIEQVRGWAGVGDLRRFIEGDLRLPWVRRQVHAAIETAAWQAFEEFTHGGASHVGPAPFAIENDAHGPRVDLREFLNRLDDVAAAIEEASHVWEPSLPFRLARLKTRCATPAARRQWVAELVTKFDHAEARRRRTRNALVHGGPLAEDTVDAVVGFAEWLAFHALGESIQGRLRGNDLIDHFLARREAHGAMYRAIRQGESLSDVLFRDPWP